MTEYRQYHFKAKVKPGTNDDLIVNLLKQKNGNYTERERVWSAIFAFWLPEALMTANSLSEKQIALQSLAAIHLLKQQIAYLSLTLSIELPNYSHLFVSNLTSSEGAISINDGVNNRTTAITTTMQARDQEQVKAYTELNGLDTQEEVNAHRHTQANILAQDKIINPQQAPLISDFDEYSQYLENE